MSLYRAILGHFFGSRFTHFHFPIYLGPGTPYKMKAATFLVVPAIVSARDPTAEVQLRGGTCASGMPDYGLSRYADEDCWCFRWGRNGIGGRNRPKCVLLLWDACAAFPAFNPKTLKKGVTRRSLPCNRQVRNWEDLGSLVVRRSSYCFLQGHEQK